MIDFSRFGGGEISDVISIRIFLPATECFDYAQLSIRLFKYPGSFIACTVVAATAVCRSCSPVSETCVVTTEQLERHQRCCPGGPCVDDHVAANSGDDGLGGG